MGEVTNIPWCDATWNPWYGCKPVSPACDNCYARGEMTRYGIDPTIIHRSKTKFADPLKWSRNKTLPAGSGIFTCSWSDFFIDAADPWRPEAWDVIRATPEYIYLILTKRPERILKSLPADWGNGWKNVWLGITAEDQFHLDQRMRDFYLIPCAGRFVSFEPLLGPIDYYLWHGATQWIIAGGENGAHARPTHEGWIRHLACICEVYRIPFFFKGWGRWLPTSQRVTTVPRTWLERDPVMRAGPAGSGDSGWTGTWLNSGTEAGDILDCKTYHETPFQGIRA